MRGFYRIAPFLLGATSAAGCVGAGESESVDAQESPVNAADKGDYVRTPFGLQHKDCVHDVGDDAVLDPDGTVTHPDGSKTHIDCGHDAPLEEPTTNGWIMSRSYWTPSWTKKMIATFTVPESPHDQTKLIYLFPGMEPASGGSIIQTVLSFGYGGPHWSISSWDCGGGPNGSCPHSAMKTVHSGDVIHATMVGSSCYSTGRCLWTITTKDTTTGVATTLTTARQPAMLWAFGGALEAYGVDYCDQYPESGSETFSSIHVYNKSLTDFSPVWSGSVSDVTPACGYTTSASTHTVKLAHMCKPPGESCSASSTCCSGSCLYPCPYYGSGSCCK